MKINKENYPVYFLDYYEDRLSEAARAELMDFLAHHPELKEAFDAFEAVRLEPDEGVRFQGKGSLKRGVVTPDNYDWYLSAYASGDLGDKERAAVEAFAQTTPACARELSLMKLTRLEADASIVFEGKQALKRHVLAPAAAVPGAGMALSGDASLKAAEPVSPAGEGQAGSPRVRRLFATSGRLWYYGSVAAVVMIMAGLFFLMEPQPSGTEIAQDIPAVGPVDQPEAVAEVPPPQQVPIADPIQGSVPDVQPQTASQTPLSRRAGDQTAPSRAASDQATASRPTSDQGVSRAASDQGVSRAASDQAASRAAAQAGLSHPTSGSAVRPLLASRIEPMTLPDVAGGSPDLSPRTEFAYWSARTVSPDLFAADDSEPSADDGQVRLSQLALNRLQQNLPPVDFDRAENRIAETGSSVKELAKTSITGLERVVSGIFNPEQEPGEEGREVQFALGSGFRVSRTTSPE